MAMLPVNLKHLRQHNLLPNSMFLKEMWWWTSLTKQFNKAWSISNWFGKTMGHQNVGSKDLH